MMKRGLFTWIWIAALFSFSTLKAQTSTADEMYTDYQKYFNEAVKVFTTPKNFIPKNVKELQHSAASLKEEAVSENPVKILNDNSKLLSDEDIYTKAKNSVFIIGKIRNKVPGSDIQFDLTGTAFSITTDGVCVTNYHVLQNIIKKTDSIAAADSIYFIMTLAKKVYFIDKILAYSQNNDIAVFKVNTQGDQLKPIPLGKPAHVGAAVYCISHPTDFFYYFSKGMVARNVTVPIQQAAAGYNATGKPPIRMEITADYGVGSSGGPILDKYGNLIGMVSSTIPFGFNMGAYNGHQQMVIKDAIPLVAITGLLKKEE